MSPSKILVVDDQPFNVQLLKRGLEKAGIVVLTACSGREALDSVAHTLPDLILLDVMMPGMDGIEVCRRLRADEEARHIPIIFVTARDSKEEKLEGLGVGATDYITKPIDLDETLARVQTQLRFARINREMRSLQRRLTEARRAADIGAVSQGIAHNLNNLLGVALGYLDLIKSRNDKPEQVANNAQSVENALQRIVTLVKQLNSLVAKSRLPLARCKLGEIIESAVARYQAENKIAQPVTIDNPLGDHPIYTSMEILEDALGKILVNAWESYGKKPAKDRPITLRTAIVEMSGGRMIEITVRDSGCGVDETLHDHIFEPFVSSKNTAGVGMGLTIARHALRNLGGEVNLHPVKTGGTSAVIIHPVEAKPAAPPKS